MAICLFTKKHYDESGNIVQTVRIADFIQKLIASPKLEDLQNEAVIILVKDDEDKEIVSRFIKDINPNIQVKKISEFKEENHKINCCIAPDYFNWEKELSLLSFKEIKPPLILMPRYDNPVNIKSIPESVSQIVGGFDKEYGDVGVIPSPALLAATAGEVISPDVFKNAFEQLDPKIKSYLGNVESYLTQHPQRNFTYQYSRDRHAYFTFYVNSTPYQAYQSDQSYKPEKITKGKNYTSVEFFLREHLMLVGNAAQSQDVLCIGAKSEYKLQALAMLKEDLIQKGYTRVSFIDIDNYKEQVIYESNTRSGSQKEYRVLYSKSIPFSSMQMLPLIATGIVGVTGDQSLVEAMSAKKLVTYECLGHKSDLTIGYLKAVQEEMSGIALTGTSCKEIMLLARFLIKPAYHGDVKVEYKQEEVARLLGNINTVEALKNINRTLVVKSQYLASIEKLLVSEVLPYIKRQQIKKINSSEPEAKPQKILNNQKIAELLRSLYTEVMNHKTNSTQWNNRFQAATQLYQLAEKEVISQEDSPNIKAQLDIITKNEPSWFELSLVTQILDIISLGLIPIIRHLFFKHDETMTRLKEIQDEINHQEQFGPVNSSVKL